MVVIVLGSNPSRRRVKMGPISCLLLKREESFVEGGGKSRPVIFGVPRNCN
jgi:hypothetical protein